MNAKKNTTKKTAKADVVVKKGYTLYDGLLLTEKQAVAYKALFGANELTVDELHEVCGFKTKFVTGAILTTLIEKGLCFMQGKIPGMPGKETIGLWHIDDDAAIRQYTEKMLAKWNKPKPEPKPKAKGKAKGQAKLKLA